MLCEYTVRLVMKMNDLIATNAPINHKNNLRMMLFSSKKKTLKYKKETSTKMYTPF